MNTPAASFPFPTKPAFDPVARQCASETLSFTEAEALEEVMWQQGEDAALQEDIRFRPTSWGRWILSDRYLANEAIYRAFHRDERVERAVSEALKEIEEEVGRTCVFCPGDPRFEVNDGVIRFSASELSNQPRIEDASELEKYKTHLPIHTLKAVAASEPAGEWGEMSQEDVIDTLGWIRVDLPGRGLNDKMFVARIKGHSMDDGRRGFMDGVYALFELWPTGKREEFPAVLVRGSFSDPETGNYALKRYDPEERDENRERREIRLVSLNPDKEKYPDIVLSAEDEPDVAVVAKLIDSLDPSQFTRRPKPRRRKGVRDLTSDEGRQRIRRDLDKAAERFFGAEAKQPGEVDDRSDWGAHLVCLDVEAGDLHIETDPLGAFPSFVKTLQLAAGDFEQPVIASNLRHRAWRTSVPVCTGVYQWKAPGHEEILGEDLEKLTVEGLSESAVTGFKLDASGIGRRLTGTTLSPGQHYRLVLPPDVSMEFDSDEIVSLGEGWRLWELPLPIQVSGKLRDALKELGFGFAKGSPQLQWAGALPACYCSNGAGELYPVYREEETPLLRITGLETEEEGELSVFLAGEDAFETIPLPPGEEWWVRMDDLPPGGYVVEAVHRRTQYGRNRLLFRVEDGAPNCPSCTVMLSELDEDEAPQSYEADESGRIELEVDLRNWFDEGSERSLRLTGPACRRVAAYWDDGKRRRIADFYLDEKGEACLDDALPAVTDLANRNAVGTLDLDLGELAQVRIRHGKDVGVDEVLETLRDWFASRGEDAEQLRGQYPLLRTLWLDRVLGQLYHGVREIDPAHLDDLPAESGGTVLLAEESHHSAERILRKPRRVIVVGRSEEDVRDGAGSGLHELAVSACKKTALKEAVITDGFVWARFTPGRKVQHDPIDLRQALGEGEELLFERFLLEHAITV